MGALKERQAAGLRVEQKMIDFLLQFTPVEILQVGDVLTIARRARGIAFEEFAPGGDGKE